jgi:hypothetical protein
LQDDSDPILGIEVAVCPPQLQEDILTAHYMRHAKKQHLADDDDVQSEITYIDVGTNVTYGSHHAMTMSPGLNSGLNDDISSKGTMEAVLAQEDASTHLSHNPHGQSTSNHTIPPSSDEECALGATFLMPIGECISHMAPNTATEDALLELYTILSRAGVQLYLFDEVIAFIEQHVNTTFQKGHTVGRSDTNKGWALKESHTYEKRPTKMQQASHNQTTNKILSHFYQLI